MRVLRQGSLRRHVIYPTVVILTLSRTWGCEKNAEPAPSGGSDGLLYLLGAAGCALGVVEINQELGL